MAVASDPPPAADDGVNPPDFAGAVRTDNTLPSHDILRRIADLPVLDREGKAHPFKSLYAQPGRTLIVFVRHFFCGNCQEYLRILSLAIPPSALAKAPFPTRVVVIGCGEPALIDMYAEAAACAYPVYSDPTRRLYDELGMVRTLALGAAPAYMRQTNIWASSLRSIVQGLRQIPRGLALKSGNQRQVGGEFLFETKQLGNGGDSADKDTVTVTWCHRMTTTRDHAETDELQEVLGLERVKVETKDEVKNEAERETKEEVKPEVKPGEAPAPVAATA